MTLTVRYTRFPTRTANIALTGGGVAQDFDLGARDDAQPVRTEPSRGNVTPRDTQPTRVQPGARPAAAAPARTSATIVVVSDPRVGFIPDAPLVDSTAFADVAGPTSLATALAGRFSGVEVRSASTLGGTSAVLVRGAHSISGTTQPLVVVNGILFDDSDIATTGQRTGQGGFDYGSGINDLNLEDIAAVQLLRGPMAAMRYGGRAANGVLLVTTKSGRGLNGFSVSGSQQYTLPPQYGSPAFRIGTGRGWADSSPSSTARAAA